MNNYPLIKKWLGLIPFEIRDYHSKFILADDLESKLAEGFEVYESGDGAISFSNCQLGNTHALAIGKQPIKQQTQAEAALEYIRQLTKYAEENNLIHEYEYTKAKKILEMK